MTVDARTHVGPGDEVLSTWNPRTPLQGPPPVPSRVVFRGGDEVRTILGASPVVAIDVDADQLASASSSACDRAGRATDPDHRVREPRTARAPAATHHQRSERT